MTLDCQLHSWFIKSYAHWEGLARKVFTGMNLSQLNSEKSCYKHMCILDVLELYRQVHTCQNIPVFTGLFQRDFVLHMMIAVEALK